MYPQTLKFQNITFKEHPIVDFAQSEPNLYDVTAIGLNYPSSFIVNGFFSLEAYCESLLHNISVIGKTDITNFLDYQCKSLKNPTEWLDQLESLIDKNTSYFNDEEISLKVNKLYMNIQICRENFKQRRKPLKNQLLDWENIIPSDNLGKFDFNIMKYDLSKLDSYNAKKVYLIELKADFLQSENICSISANKSFGALIDIELEKIEKLREIPIEAIAEPVANSKNLSKLRINGNSNLLVDVFYRLLHEFKPEGKPFIDNTPTEVAKVIIENFTNRDGNDLSLSTVKSTLCPSKVEKRPTCDKRFCMKHLIPVSILLFSAYISNYLLFRIIFLKT